VVNPIALRLAAQADAPGSAALNGLVALDGPAGSWLQNMPMPRGVPPRAVIARLEALRPLVADVATGAAALIDLGRQELLDGLV
jgi:hypothetical protein